MYVVSHTEVTRSLSEPRAFFREAPVCKKLTPKLVQFSQKYYRIMLVPCHETMPSFMIFRHVLELQELKNQVSQSFRPSHDAHMFEFHSHFLHGTYKFTQRHTCDFSTNFGALELVLVFQIRIMHIKYAKNSINV